MLQYADTTLFIYNDRIQSVMTMKCIVKCSKLYPG